MLDWCFVIKFEKRELVKWGQGREGDGIGYEGSHWKIRIPNKSYFQHTFHATHWQKVSSLTQTVASFSSQCTVIKEVIIINLPEATWAKRPAVIATTPLPQDEIAKVLDSNSSGNPLFLWWIRNKKCVWVCMCVCVCGGGGGGGGRMRCWGISVFVIYRGSRAGCVSTSRRMRVRVRPYLW